MDPYERIRERLERTQFDIGITLEILKLIIEKRPDAKGKKRPASHRANPEGQVKSGAEIFDLFGE